MADSQLQTILNSGGITNINIGGTATTDKVLKADGTISQTKTAYIPQNVAPTHIEGQVYYNNVTKSFGFQGPFSGIEVKAGHEIHMHVINNSGALIEAGMAVKITGVSVGGIPTIEKAQANSFLNARVRGITVQAVNNGAETAITTFGEIDNINTLGIATGVPLYLSETVAGTYTATAPAIKSVIGGSLVASATVGKLFVTITNNQNIPTVLAALQGQSTGGLYSLTTTAQDLVNFASKKEVVTTANITTGVITLPANGDYKVTVTASITFPSSTSTRSVTFEVYDATSSTIQFSYVKNIPRDATEDGLSFSWAINKTAANTQKIRVKSSIAIDVTFTNVSYDITSISISS